MTAKKGEVEPVNVNTRLFPIGTTAMFFDRTTQWLRWRQNEGRLKDKRGRPIGSRRNNNKGEHGGDRVFTVRDVKNIAFSLHREGILDADNLERVLARVEAFSYPVKTRKLNAQPATKKKRKRK